MFLTISNNIRHFTKIYLIIIVIVLILTFILYNFANDDDFANLPPKDKNKFFDDRFYSLFYYNSSTQGGLGDALIYPKSNRARVYTSLYLILAVTGLFTAII
jgi:hypothetical protein